MGSVVRELEKAARNSGAEMLTRVDLHSLDVTGKKRCAEFELDGKTHAIEARFLLVNFGRNVLAKLLGKPYQPDPTDEGSVFKINMLLRRLPKLKTKSHAEAEAFCGTFRINEGYEEMNLSYQQACRDGCLTNFLRRSIVTRSPTTAFYRQTCARRDSTP